MLKLVFFALVALTASAPLAPQSIVQIALETPELSTLVTALKAADLVSALNGTGPFTVFAPTNEAFEKLPAGVLQHLLQPENKAELVKVLTYHVASGKVQAADIKNDEHIKTLEGEDVTAFVRDDGVFLEGGSERDFARVIKADVEASNGVVHIIDNILLPPAAPGPSPGPSPSPGKKTIVELALDTPELSTLVTALKAADLVSALNGTGPFTVFAPTNEAFAKIPPEDLKKLLEPENKATLVKILTFHVASGDVQGADIKNDEHIKTLEGEEVTAIIYDSELYIKGGERENIARVIKADVEASNGVVHLIDHVLIPEAQQQIA